MAGSGPATNEDRILHWGRHWARALTEQGIGCNGLVGRVIIRNIDDRVLERLKARAAAQRKSLEQALRDLLTEAAALSRQELLADLERIRAMTPPRQPGAAYPTAEQLIREDRDAR